MPTGPKRKGNERNELARLCARLHYEEGLAPERIYARLKDDADLRSVRDVRALIKRAIDLPLVRVRVEDVIGRPAIDPDLSEQVARVAGIRRAIVVCSPYGGDNSWASPDEVTQRRAWREADALHLQLGHAAAHYLRDALRPGDAIGVGPGRGVGFTVLELKRHLQGVPLELGTLTVFSLAGTMWVQAWEKRGVEGDYLDADENALQLSNIPGATADLSVVGLRLFIEGKSQERSAFVRMGAPHLLGDDWREQLGQNRPKLDISIFGVGALNAKGTHFAMAIPHPGPQAGAFDEIEELRNEIVPECPGAIVDIGDRFWVREVLVPKALRQRTKDVVRRLNEKMVSVSFAKLGAAHQRLVVAGGDQKYDGILALLGEGRQLGVHPTVLVTDSGTARRMIRDLSMGGDAAVNRPRGGRASTDMEPASPWLREVADLAARSGGTPRKRDD